MKSLSLAVLGGTLTLSACSSDPFPGPLDGSWDSLRGSFDGGAHDTLPGRPALAVSIVGKVTGDAISITLPFSAVTPGVPLNPGYGTIAFDGRRGQPEVEQVCRD